MVKQKIACVYINYSYMYHIIIAGNVRGVQNFAVFKGRVVNAKI